MAQDKCCWGGAGGLAGNRPAWPPRSAYGEPAARNRGGAPFTCRKWVLRTGPRKSVLPPPRAERPSEGWYSRGRMQNKMHKTKRKRWRACHLHLATRGGRGAVPHGPRGRSRCAARRQHARVGRVWADSFGTGRGASWHKLVGVVDSVGPTRGHCAGRARPRRRTARSVNGRLQSLMRSLGPVRGQIQPSASIARLEQSSRNPRCVSLVPPSYKRLDLLARPIHLSSGRTS